MNRLILLFVYVVTFLTGFAGLTYQVVWQRYLTRMFGADTISTTIILSVFLGGLSFGYYSLGKWTAKIKNPLIAYALLEAILSIWGLSFNYLYELTESVTAAWSFEPPFLVIIQGVIVAVILMGIPTFCMGGTIPMLTRGLSETISISTKVHAWVYGINTLGAFVGTLAAGFYLIEQKGLSGSLVIAAFLNGISAIFFFLFFFNPGSFFKGGEVDTDKVISYESISDKYSLFNPFQLYLISFLSGFYVIGLENVFIRITKITLGSSSYSFSIIVSVFILAIAFGSLWIGSKKKIGPTLLFYTHFAITVILLLIFMTLDLWPYIGHIIRISFQSNIPGFWFYHIAILSFIFFILFVPVALMGATIPITFHELKRDLSCVGIYSGNILSFNGIGALLGSLFGGMIFFYFLELHTVYLLMVLFAAIGMTVSSMPLKREFSLISAGCVVITLMFLVLSPYFKYERFAVGTFRFQEIMPVSLKGATKFYDSFIGAVHLDFLKTGPMNTVAVASFKNSKGKEYGKTLFSNGRSESGLRKDGEWDMATMILSGQIPALFAESRKDVMIIGLGSGVTGGEFTLYDDVETLNVAEISDTIIEALPLFSDYNNALEKNSRLKIEKGDALRILRRGEKKWDIIVSEPSNPFITGVDQLFNKEFYELVNDRLKEKGVLMQWIQGYSTTPEIFSMVFATMNRVFENIYIFEGGKFDYLILGMKEPIGINDLMRVNELISSNEKVKASLHKIGINSTHDLLARINVELISLAWKTRDIEEANNPKIHFMAGRGFFMGKTLQDAIDSRFNTPEAVNIMTKYSSNFLSENPTALFPKMD